MSGAFLKCHGIFYTLLLNPYVLFVHVAFLFVVLVSCCGFLLPGLSVRVSVTFHLMCVYIILVRFGLQSGHLLGKSYSLQLLYFDYRICNSSYFPICFEGGIRVLIVFQFRVITYLLLFSCWF